MREIRIVWAIVAALVTVVAVTYSRLPSVELYNVHSSGIRGGLGRAIVELNYPTALVAVAVVGVIAPSLPNRLRPFAAVAALLCLVVVVPGVVRQSDLDVRWINAVPALGVGLALALSPAADLPSLRWRHGDRFRVVLGIALVLAALPWIAAALGLFLDRFPVLGRVFQTGAFVSYHGDALHHAVHHGQHHGLDGLVVALAALLLSRVPNRISLPLALLLAYGVADVVNDEWLEQIAERGWTSWTVPGSIQPAANLTWLAVLLAASLVWAFWFSGRRAAGPLPPRGPASLDNSQLE
jgi:hypothetical protein